MVTKPTIEYMHWDDIEQFICDKLGIPQDKFRDYHDVIGGDYKDWWHVWLTLNYEQITNDSFIKSWKNVLNWDGARKEYGDWINVLEPALDALFGDEESILVCYSW